jgi:hypothetical protein
MCKAGNEAGNLWVITMKHSKILVRKAPKPINHSVTKWQISAVLGYFCVFCATVKANGSGGNRLAIDPAEKRSIVTLVASR